jgi:intein/homing endonuclease
MRRESRNFEIVMDQGEELIQFYRENPCIAAYDLLRVDFAPIQRLIFEDMWFKDYTIAVASRGLGKTFLLGTLAALSCLLYPGYRAGLIASVFRQSLVINSNTYDTLWTNRGLKTTAKEFYDSVQPGLTQIQSLDSQNTILSKWENDDRACRYIKTTKGFELAGTTDHGVLILNNDFDIKFKDLQDLRYDDYIAIKTGFNYFGNDNSMSTFDEFECNWRTKDCEIPTELTTNLSYWMGLVIGDGCLIVNDRTASVDFVNEDQDLLDSFENYLREYFLLDKNENIDRRNRKNNTWEIRYYCKKLIYYLLKCGFTKTTALDKKIPDVVKKASKENFIAFLQGLYDTDGGVYIQNHKHGYSHCEVAFNTSSLRLAKEVQAVLLNLGIISNLGISKKACIRQLPQGNKPSICAEAYKIRITGKEFLTKFNNIIGFRCKKKDTKFTNYLHNYLNREESLARALGLPGYIVNKNYSKCADYLEQGLYFVKLKEDKYFLAPTIDVEVENEHCYWSNGFISHNSKMIFSEVEKIYAKSPILREACEKKPIHAPDRCYLKFKSIGGTSGSYIEALPLGVDGSKIRGSRFYLLLIDELAQVPDKTLDMVVRPMGATTLEPMENVRRLEKQNRLIELGLATEDDFEEGTVNKMVMTSSGFYKFNHMWRRMKDYWRQMEEYGDKSKYAVWQVPHWELPMGFLDKNNILEAKRIMSDAEFRMEYEAAMISDSEGFFKASMLEMCTMDSGFTIELKGEPGAEYIVGIDPSQGGSASCGVVIIKIGKPSKVANVLELKLKTTQELTQVTQTLCEIYNVARIFMDKGGGGKAIMDLLEEGYGGYDPIIDRTDKEKRNVKGRHILEMVNFNPAWISDANFTTLSMLENRSLLFPEAPLSTADVLAEAYESIRDLKKQMLNIIVTQTGAGALHFDTPKKGQNKDLYSAMILAAHGVRMFNKELEEDADPILYNKSGFVREHGPNTKWGVLNSKRGVRPGIAPIGNDRGIFAASLKGKRRLK